jgi:hypothetical protein
VKAEGTEESLSAARQEVTDFDEGYSPEDESSAQEGKQRAQDRETGFLNKIGCCGIENALSVPKTRFG